MTVGRIDALKALDIQNGTGNILPRLLLLRFREKFQGVTTVENIQQIIMLSLRQVLYPQEVQLIFRDSLVSFPMER